MTHRSESQMEATVQNLLSTRNQGWPKTTWRRSTEAEVKQTGMNWNQLEKMAKDRRRWRSLVDDLCSNGNLRVKKEILSMKWPRAKRVVGKMIANPFNFLMGFVHTRICV